MQGAITTGTFLELGRLPVAALHAFFSYGTHSGEHSGLFRVAFKNESVFGRHFHLPTNFQIYVLFQIDKFLNFPWLKPGKVSF